MAALEYSNDALNIKAAFYGAQKMVYVEGEDDVIFWEVIFKIFDKHGLKVEALGGVAEVKKMVVKIAADNIDAVVARDADFTDLDVSYQAGANVITTYGHSIENTLITGASLHYLAKAYGRIPNGILTEELFDEWIVEFESSFFDLVILDAANDVGGLGESVLSSNCTRYMKNQNSCVPCAVKIQGYIAKLQSNLSLVQQAENIKAIFFTLPKRVADFIRGHFLASAAMKKVNRVMQSQGAGKAVNNDSFTSSLLMSFELLLNPNHPHFEHYQSQAELV